MKVGVLGAGSFGTTLALVLNSNNHDVTCWSFEKNTVDDIKAKGINTKFLPGVEIPRAINFTTDLYKTAGNKDVIVVAVPSQAVREVLLKLDNKFDSNSIWVNVAKGIENNTLLRISQVLNEAGKIPEEQIAVLYGPSHAEEVSRKVPTAIVAASASLETAGKIQKLFMTSYFRVYASQDVIGVELGGSLKNIIALAAGICDGANFGDNTKAALITRGLVEINRMGVKLGANPSTFAGLSGLGDLVVTCMSQHSRNRYVGEQIGKGRKLDDILSEMAMVAEGVKTTKSAYDISIKESIEMPITEQVYKTLFENKSPIEAMKNLMTRESKIEDWGS
ncbi:MAG: NAD(P)H-dependent glycerol-3-phosphate dehydrogenase [Calditrichia bacterium]|nr:NAD(P)H-dependent glycerol-3-phosphate dehydrogenase [Calditrichia bacterium]